MRSRAARLALGLRLQILLALSVAFVIAFALLSVVSVRIAQRSRTADRVSDAQASARALAAALGELGEGSDDRRRFAALSSAVVGHGGIRGVELTGPPVGGGWSTGVSGLGIPVDAVVTRGRTVRVWVRPPEPGSSPFGTMMRAYVALSGGLTLLMATLLLTVLIVRPVDAVTRAASRLADGKLDQDVPVRGAAEVVELAVTFNRMAHQLRRDREALEARLRELEQKTMALAEAREQVVRGERLASVGRLAAGVAHEIGNPLSAVLGLIELLRAGDLPAETQQEFLGRIERETERIHHIIGDLLDFSRQQPAISDGPVDLEQVVEDTVRLVAPQRDLGALSLVRSVATGTPRARGDHDQCTQIVLNLVLNAADAIEGEGEIALRLDSVVEGEGDDRLTWVRLQVADSGAGIAPEVLDTLFEPFVTTKGAGRGTGLGLAVVHSLAERMGGRVTAANDPSGGAVFSLWLPMFT